MLSEKSSGGGYLMLGKQALITCFSKLQRKVADSSTHAETNAAHTMLQVVIEVHEKLKGMGEEAPLPVPLQQDNNCARRFEALSYSPLCV